MKSLLTLDMHATVARSQKKRKERKEVLERRVEERRGRG